MIETREKFFNTICRVKQILNQETDFDILTAHEAVLYREMKEAVNRLNALNPKLGGVTR